jgi:hypothetical protein
MTQFVALEDGHVFFSKEELDEHRLYALQLAYYAQALNVPAGTGVTSVRDAGNRPA